MRRKDESGQALVLVLLSLSVVLTLVLFILSRSVTDVAVSSRQEESVRAFSAAEAGIERLLVTGANWTDGSIGYTAKVTGLAEGSTEYAYPIGLSSGDSATIWFMDHDPISGNLITAGGFRGTGMKVCWGNSGTSGHSLATPAIEVSVYYETTRGDLSTIKIARTAYDPFNATGTRLPLNSFTPAPVIGTCSIGGESFAFQKIIDASVFPTINPDGLVLARIKMFYNGATPHGVGVSVAGWGELPSQGQQIDSNGFAGDSNRRIVVRRGWAVSPFPFASNAVFSPVGITK